MNEDRTTPQPRERGDRMAVLGRGTATDRPVEAQLAARVRQQATVAFLGARALAGMDLAILLQEAVARVAETLQVEYCKVLELVPDGLALRLRAGVGWQEGLVGQATVSVGAESQAGYTLLADAPVIVDDLRTEPRFSGPPLLHEHSVVSGLSVIIPGREQPFGVLGAHTTTRRTFTTDDAHFLQSVAHLLATVIERKQVERYLAAQHAVSRILAESPNLDAAAPQVLRALGEALGWQWGALWCVEQQDHALRCQTTWHTPEFPVGEFDALSRGMSIPSGVGLPGRVWARGEPVWVVDVLAERNFPRLEVAAREGLHAAFAFPVRSGQGVLGVVEFLSDEIRPPDRDLLQTAVVLGGQLGQLVERTRAEDAMRASEARKAAIVEAALDCVISIDHEGNVTEFNPAAEETFGYPRAAAVGRELAALIIPPRLREQHRRGLAHYLATGAGAVIDRRVELTGMRADGSEFPVELTVTRIPADGPPQFTGFLRDTTERKRAETERERLLAREQAGRAAAERTAERLTCLQEVTAALSHALTAAEVAELIVAQGQAALAAQGAMLAVVADDGSTLDVVHTAGYPQELVARWRRFSVDTPVPLADAVRSGAPIFLESRAARAARYPHLAREQAVAGGGAIAALPLHVEGRTLGAVGLSFAEDRRFDADEQAFVLALARQCAQALARARLQETARQIQVEAEAGERLGFLAKASALLAGSLDYEVTLTQVAALAVPRLADICVVDLVTDDGQIRRLTSAHTDPAKQAVLDELQRRYPPDPTGPHPSAAAIRTGEVAVYPEVPDALLVSIAQDARHLEILRALALQCFIVAPLVARGRTLGALWLIATDPGRHYTPVDMTLAEELGRRGAQAVDNARLYQDAQQAVRVREEFLAATSHELRTPLSHIKGFASTLLQPDVEWDTETQRDFLTEIEREADRLGRLISDLLDVSRIESGGLDAGGRAAVQPLAVVTAGLARVSGAVGARPLKVDVPADLPLVVMDAAQLEHVLANLLENAAKYSPPGGAIRLAGAAVAGELELRVEDEGPGIPAEDLERVFEKFYRARSSERSGIPGTGLGLAICRGIILAHGGRIWAENRPGGGARFVVRLPAAREVVGALA